MQSADQDLCQITSIMMQTRSSKSVTAADMAWSFSKQNGLRALILWILMHTQRGGSAYADITSPCLLPYAARLSVEGTLTCSTHCSSCI